MAKEITIVKEKKTNKKPELYRVKRVITFFQYKGILQTTNDLTDIHSIYLSIYLPGIEKPIILQN